MMHTVDTSSFNWAEIENWPHYFVSRRGEVFSSERQVESKFSVRVKPASFVRAKPNTKGYLRVRLCRAGKEKHFLLHRLVATAFIPNPLGLPEVNHKDRNRLNCSVDNLEWVTSAQNHAHWRAFGPPRPRSRRSK